VTGKQAHYLFTVKANQPTLLGRCARLAWQRVPVLDRTRDRAHGRVELRNLAIGALCRAGPVNLAAALRHHARDHTDPWPPSGSPSDENGHHARTPEPWVRSRACRGVRPCSPSATGIRGRYYLGRPL
jgi:hypothetical protein